MLKCPSGFLAPRRLGASATLDLSLYLGQGILVPLEQAESLDGVAAVDTFHWPHAGVLNAFNVLNLCKFAKGQQAALKNQFATASRGVL